MKRSIWLIFLVLLVTFADSSAQKKKAERAYAAFEAGEYYEAIDQFKDTYSRTRGADKSVRADISFMVGECYRLTNDPRNAETWYKLAVRSSYPKPDAQFWLAMSMKKNGKYQQAIDELKKYKQIAPSDARGDQEIRACELALEWQRNPEPYNVEELKDLNSREADFGPAYARDDFGLVYFTSSREDAAGNKKHGATGQGYTDIFESRIDKKSKWSTPVPVDGLNSEFEDGTPSFSADYKEVYFTRCEVGKREQKGCVIMFSKKSADRWDEPKNVGILADSLVAAHPALAPDGLTLYFVSEKEGGFGGKDIWMVTRSAAGDAWSAPVNAGPDINTSGDELFPYVRTDGILYFSSDGHIGMGGLDIFRAAPQPDGSWVVTNMKAPLNTSADDFAITFENDSEKGIFSSTRKGRGNDELYAFEFPPLKFNVTGLVRDEKSGTAIAGSTVMLIASDGNNLQAETGNGGEFRFALREDVDYIFLAQKEGYLNGKEKETTKGQERSRDFMVTILLTAIDRPIELPNIFYDFNKWDLRPESMVSLDKLVETLNDNPKVTIELMSHTDSRDTEEYNYELSQKRAQSVVDYLIGKGIEPDRLSARGYGESNPKVVDEEIARQASFLKSGTTLTETYINSLANEEQKEIAHQINRRTEFRVLRTDYSPPKE
ncbi:MAG TPA: OmpA family protein [Bacteroidales bacterium]|nr:OmpA family protein [Bacteroidales bacterium]HPJ60712.1 OmpA family protein [Bacteroidales bacterium]HPR12004.1 OmpA family protein [Bacteroidales bacterium]HRW86577.1 OmpA family protein [Bacteroidales bacterium]